MGKYKLWIFILNQTRIMGSMIPYLFYGQIVFDMLLRLDRLLSINRTLLSSNTDILSAFLVENVVSNIET